MALILLSAPNMISERTVAQTCGWATTACAQQIEAADRQEKRQEKLAHL